MLPSLVRTRKQHGEQMLAKPGMFPYNDCPMDPDTEAELIVRCREGDVACGETTVAWKAAAAALPSSP